MLLNDGSCTKCKTSNPLVAVVFGDMSMGSEPASCDARQMKSAMSGRGIACVSYEGVVLDS